MDAFVCFFTKISNFDLIRMLSTGIKNSILILLIILIFHFLIKNMMLSHKNESFAQPSSADIKCKTPEVKKLDVPSSAESDSLAQSLPANVSDKVSDKASTADVYNSWFGEDNLAGGSSSDADLDKFFEGEMDIKAEAVKAAQCPIPVKSPELPLSSTCDVNFEKLPADVVSKRVKANCNLPQDKKRQMVLAEYENENTMNGGKLFMDLEAYDREDVAFATL
jgi:hypothetical protein